MRFVYPQNNRIQSKFLLYLLDSTISMPTFSVQCIIAITGLRINILKLVGGERKDNKVKVYALCQMISSKKKDVLGVLPCCLSAQRCESISFFSSPPSKQNILYVTD